MPLAPGSSFGPYQVIEPLGKGGMATVYKVYEAKLDRFVALKVLPPEFLHEDTFAARFQREALIIARLEHKDIVPIYGFGIDEGIPWMAMRLMPGGTLSALLRDHGPLAPARAMEVLRSVAGALQHAHAQGVIHRDLKPQNVLLDDAGQVYLADFGIAKLMEGSTVLSRTGRTPGTPQYMAPEQALAQAADHRVDVYALGVMAYQMLTGRLPFDADTPLAVLMQHAQEPIPLEPLRGLAAPLQDAVIKALAKQPADRWPSASAFGDALTAATTPTVPMSVLGGSVSVSDDGQGPSRTPRRPPPVRHRRRKPRVSTPPPAPAPQTAATDSTRASPAAATPPEDPLLRRVAETLRTKPTERLREMLVAPAGQYTAEALQLGRAELATRGTRASDEKLTEGTAGFDASVRAAEESEAAESEEAEATRARVRASGKGWLRMVLGFAIAARTAVMPISAGAEGAGELTAGFGIPLILVLSGLRARYKALVSAGAQPVDIIHVGAIAFLGLMLVVAFAKAPFRWFEEPQPAGRPATTVVPPGSHPGEQRDPNQAGPRAIPRPRPPTGGESTAARGGAFPTPSSAAPGCQELQFRVDAGRWWQSTGVTLDTHDSANISASGTWGQSGKMVGPDGDASFLVDGPCVGVQPSDCFPVWNKPAMLLVGRLGPSGQSFVVGSGRSLTASDRGTLELAPNDRRDLLWDNVGSLSVRIVACPTREDSARRPLTISVTPATIHPPAVLVVDVRGHEPGVEYAVLVLRGGGAVDGIVQVGAQRSVRPTAAQIVLEVSAHVGPGRYQVLVSDRRRASSNVAEFEVSAR